jgi:hypothetical protein
VAAEGNPLVGFTLMFTYALGIGVLFFAIAVFSVSLPTSGRWMDWVKSIGGIRCWRPASTSRAADPAHEVDRRRYGRRPPPS